MPTIVPYYESEVGAEPGISRIQHLTEELGHHVLIRDWHLAHAEDRRYAAAHSAGAAAVGGVLTYGLDDMKEARAADRQVRRAESRLASDLDKYRQSLSTWDRSQRNAAEALLRQQGLPADLLPSPTNTQTDESEWVAPNLIDWMSRKPTAGGAPNQVLAGILRWTGQHAAAVARDPETQKRVAEQVGRYKAGVQAAVQSDKLSEAWLRREPVVRRIVIGHMLAPEVLRPEAENRIHGSYYAVSREMALWPYIAFNLDPRESDESLHEFTHSMGRLSHKYLNEAFTTRFTEIINGSDPDSRDDNVPLRLANLVYAAANGKLSDLATSACFIGSNPFHNLTRLRRIVRRATDGLDVIGLIDTLSDRLTRYRDREGYRLSETEIYTRLVRAMEDVSDIANFRAQGKAERLRIELESFADNDDASPLDRVSDRLVLRMFRGDRLTRKLCRAQSQRTAA